MELDNNLIEILPDVFFDPAKEWYEQPQELIDLALQVENTVPIDFEIETSSTGHQRLKWGIWEHTTSLGTFTMRVDLIYVYDINRPDFLAKEKHNKVTITKQ